MPISYSPVHVWNLTYFSKLMVNLMKKNLGISWDNKLWSIIISNNADLWVWDLTYSGNFSLHSAWQLIRGALLPSLLKIVWQKHLPLKVTIFLRKLLHNTVPTDQAVRHKDISLLSKCLCYCNSNITKFNHHQFLFSKTTTYVWDFFSNMLNIRGSVLTISHMLLHWWQLAKGNNLLTWLL